jgi:hypothetical protein
MAENDVAALTRGATDVRRWNECHQVVSQRQHADVRELLPFFINGTLSELENARVVRHLASCASCHAEREEQRRLRDLMRAAPEPPGDAQSAWTRLERALDAEPRARAEHRWVRSAWTWGLSLAAAAAMVWLFTPVVPVDPDSGATDYRALTSATPDSLAVSGTIRAVFASQATLGDIGSVDRTGLQIVSEPSPRGVYTRVRDERERSHDALAALSRRWWRWPSPLVKHLPGGSGVLYAAKSAIVMLASGLLLACVSATDPGQFAPTTAEEVLPPGSRTPGSAFDRQIIVTIDNSLSRS